MDFGDGREERMAAFDLEMRLRRNPEVMRRREEYFRKLAAKKAEGIALGRDAMIARLMAKTPGYIRELLETEEERFGASALADRYAATFYNESEQ
jgi:hypothetical protein